MLVIYGSINSAKGLRARILPTLWDGNNGFIKLDFFSGTNRPLRDADPSSLSQCTDRISLPDTVFRP